MSSANPIGKTVVPSILQPLEQDTKTILEAARLCGFRVSPKCRASIMNI